MGLLDGQIADLIYQGFKGQLLSITLGRDVIPDSPVVDSRGNVTNAVPTTWSGEGFVEDYDEMYRMNAGIPHTDSKVNIFIKSLPSGVVPIKDDEATLNRGFGSEKWKIRKCTTDPAGALYVCQSYQVQ